MHGQRQGLHRERARGDRQLEGLSVARPSLQPLGREGSAREILHDVCEGDDPGVHRSEL